MLKLLIYTGVLLVMLTKVCNGMQSSSTMSDEAFSTLRSEVLELRQKSPLAAIEQLKQILAEKKNQLTLRQTLRLTYAQALFEITSNLADDAHQTLMICRELSTKLGEPLLDYYYYSYSGRLFNQLEIYDLALENYQKSFEIASNIENQSMIYQAKNNIGFIFFNLEKYDEAQQNYEDFYQYGIKGETPSYQATALNNLGEVALKRDKIEQAFAHFTQSLKIREQHNYEQNSAWSHLNLGKVYRIKQQFSQAISHLSQAIAIHEKFTHTIEMLNAQIELAGVYQDQENHQLAIALLNKVANKAFQVRHDRTFYLAQSSLRLSFQALKQYQLALNAAEQELIAQKNILERKAKISFQHLIATTALKTKELEVSNLRQEKAIAIAEQEHAQQQTQNLLVASFLIITATLIFIYYIRQKNQKLHSALNDLEATQSQLIEAEKVSALTTLVSGMAHQLNTPLGIIVTANSIQQEKLDELEDSIKEHRLSMSDMNMFVEQSKAAITLSQNNTQKADEMIRRFKLISAELGSSVSSRFALKPFLNDKLALLANQSIIPIHFAIAGEDSEIENYPDVLFKVLNQLVINAIDHKEASTNDVKITMTLENFDQHVKIAYQDNGPGIAADLISKIFDPFFTTKGMQTRLGLGLNIAHNSVIHLMQGKLTCHSSSDGAMFIIELPKKLAEKS